MVRVLAVCLMLLCVLPAVRTTDMAVDHNKDSNNNSCYNLTLETKYNNLTTKYNHLILERDQLYNNLTLERDQLYTKYNHLILERDELEAQLILQRDQLYTKYNQLIVERDQLQREVNQLKRKIADKTCPSGWQKFGCSCYYTSTEFKTWAESREECMKTGADLLIINSKEEQEFIRGLNPGDLFASSWIGVKRTEGKWTWVDGTPLTTQYWGSDAWPRISEVRNCAAYSHNDRGWSNWSCSFKAYWICEKTHLS